MELFAVLALVTCIILIIHGQRMAYRWGYQDGWNNRSKDARPFEGESKDARPFEGEMHQHFCDHDFVDGTCFKCGAHEKAPSE